jgi:hypothetical protein
MALHADDYARIFEEIRKDLPWIIRMWQQFRGTGPEGPELLGPHTITDVPQQGTLSLGPQTIASRLVDTESHTGK